MAREIRKIHPGRPLVVETPHPELFDHNPHVTWATPAHWKTTRRHLKPKYFLSPESRDVHITDQLLSQIPGYTVRGDAEARRPEIFFAPREIDFRPDIPDGALAVCPTGKQSHSADRKEWGFDRFQAVVRALPGVPFVQIGAGGDPLLSGVTDRRGLSIRESARILLAARLFLGLEGGLMHLAAAVRTPAVILYGGAVHPASSGYPDHAILTRRPDCSPCFTSHERMTACPNALQCLSAISVTDVVREVTRIMKSR